MNEIQDIQNEQNTNPSYRVVDGGDFFDGRIHNSKTLVINNYPLDKLITIKDSVASSVSMRHFDIKYDYLSGDAFHIGEAINIIKRYIIHLA